MPRRVVRRQLARLKARFRQRQRARRTRDRVSVRVQARDVIWSLDATHLGRDDEGEVQAESLRDAASTSALSVSVGRPSSGAEVVELLGCTTKERGGPPLVLAVDGGSNYACAEVACWAATNAVVILKSLPHTPEHNAWVERGHRELKEDAELGKGTHLEPLPCSRWTMVWGGGERMDGLRVTKQESSSTSKTHLGEAKDARGGDLPRWCRRLARSVHALNERRARPSRGGWTARALDAVLPRGDDLVGRASLYQAVCREVEIAVEAAPTARAKRRARRNAILCTLESYGLVRRTRGKEPWSKPNVESQA